MKPWWILGMFNMNGGSASSQLPAQSHSRIGDRFGAIQHHSEASDVARFAEKETEASYVCWFINQLYQVDGL